MTCNSKIEALLLGGIKVIKVILYIFGSAKTYETDNREKTTLMRGLFKELYSHKKSYFLF